MEKYVRVSAMNKEHPTVYTAEEIADSVRGVGEWVWDGSRYNCPICGCGSKDGGRFCKFCGARMENR